jgi:SAM-dependent methyltransferase
MPDVPRPTKPLALDAYERLAEAYAAMVDTKPHNAYYERPATLSLLPDVAGLHVLDVGCGPGVYTEWLRRRGASVVAFDASAKMVALAKARVGDGVPIYEAAVESDLGFVEDGVFDVVLAPLVLDCVGDWSKAFRRFRRALKPGGLFVFSVGHPFFEAMYFKTERYFETEQVSCVWRGFGFPVEMPSFRRPLGAVINSVLEAGFDLVQIREPQPTEEFRRADLKHYEQLARQPSFLCIKARKAA